MEEIQLKQNIRNLDISSLPNATMKSKPNRHVSVLYGMQYLTRVPVVKRCRKTEYQCFANINKKQIFTFVFKFVQQILASPQYLSKVFSEMKFIDNQIDATIFQNNKNQKRCSILQDKLQSSCNSFQIGSPVRKNDIFQDKNKLYVKSNMKGKSCKKISIMMDQGFEDYDFKDNNQGSVLFSDESISLGLSSINICQQQFTLKMVQKIYEQPEPFLINLSVCLMLKFLYLSQTNLTRQNVCWILSVGTIVAYKIYYDEPVEGLVESFSWILKIKREDIINLQRYFLNGINHQAVISNQQYHYVLYQIISQGQKQN